jgi:hypothetical protein
MRLSGGSRVLQGTGFRGVISCETPGLKFEIQDLPVRQAGLRLHFPSNLAFEIYLVLMICFGVLHQTPTPV